MERTADAKALLAARRWSAAYYVAGYAVECGLKACILARVAAAPEILFEDKRYSERCWTHNLSQLVDLAGLKATLAADAAADLDLGQNWETATLWSESSRYQRWSKMYAEDLYNAIVDKRHGVMPWIKRYW
ncbi:MAG TPA: hypothetical protein VMS17_12255 [Gemmataceae bacterium]|nr:hypothetical protein [Gemmataceae bacterium]